MIQTKIRKQNNKAINKNGPILKLVLDYILDRAETKRLYTM